MPVSYLQRPNAPSLAYMRQNGVRDDLPTVVFLHGFHSDMMGTKAEFLAHHCAEKGQAFLRFDDSGHGQSEGKFEEGTIGIWLSDVLDAIDALSEGKIILVGSSMGGWLALLAALNRQERVAGVIGLAAAPDFTRWMQDELTQKQKDALMRDGYFMRESDYGAPYMITRALFEEGEKHCILDAAIHLSMPVRLLQGMNDADVPYKTAQIISDAITGKDKKIYLLKDGDHRLSRDEDLKLLGEVVDELSNAVE
jgi:pimeloyl-ACP methyl ester carboxylesterase